jgi:hypothetical protein
MSQFAGRIRLAALERVSSPEEFRQRLLKGEVTAVNRCAIQYPYKEKYIGNILPRKSDPCCREGVPYACSSSRVEGVLLSNTRPHRFKYS